jgi:hypothetical protein
LSGREEQIVVVGFARKREGGVARRRVGKSMKEARSNTLREEATQAGVVRAFFLFDWVA